MAPIKSGSNGPSNMDVGVQPGPVVAGWLAAPVAGWRRCGWLAAGALGVHLAACLAPGSQSLATYYRYRRTYAIASRRRRRRRCAPAASRYSDAYYGRRDIAALLQGRARGRWRRRRGPLGRNQQLGGRCGHVMPGSAPATAPASRRRCSYSREF